MSPKKAWVVVALSVAIPGLGHVYAGAFGLAVAFGLTDRLLPPALELLAGAGALSVKSLALTKLWLPLAVRGLAAVHATRAARTASEQAAPGAYGFFAVGWFVLSFALGHLTGSRVTAVPLTESGHGLKASDRVFTTRLGAAAEPRAGALAVWFEDWPDGGVSPLQPVLRQVRVGRVTSAGASSFEVDGRAVPISDYGGVPLGVLSAPAPGGQSLDWDRIGAAPSP